MLKDRYGNELSTTSTPARDAYQAGMDSLMSATAGMDAHFAEAVAADEAFALAHISLARAKQLLGRGHEAKAPACGQGGRRASEPDRDLRRSIAGRRPRWK